MSGDREEKEPRTEPWGTPVLQSQGDLETKRKPRKEEKSEECDVLRPNAGAPARGPGAGVGETH